MISAATSRLPRLPSPRFLLEHDGLAGDRRIHSIWRDAEADFRG